MEKYDVIVIGGGLLGCFALRALTRYDIKTALFERREDICTGISRANTAIVYSGCDTKPNTVKTEMCVRSAQDFDRLCARLGVKYSRCGSLMVSFGPKGDESLRRKYEQGLTNGVRDIRLLSGREALKLEPNLAPNVSLALYVPDTGTVNPWELCLAAVENAISNGAELYLNAEVSGIKQTPGGYIVKAGDTGVFTRGIINCAGLNADKVYEMLAGPGVRIVPSAGDYLVLDTKAADHISHVIFHESEQGKGLTLVPTIDGNILVGPTEREDEGGGENATSIEGIELLYSLAAEVMPSLPMEHVIRSFGAARPNPYYVAREKNGDYSVSEKSISDFCVLEDEAAPGFYSFIGIKTPGLTCAHELGLRAGDMAAKSLGLAENNGFDPFRPPPVSLGDLPFEKRAALIRENPAYGRIVCRCREISEGEIIDAIRKYPGAVTVDGVKRRVRATTGRCQGSYCTERIIELLAREKGRLPEDILKDGPGSFIYYGGEDDGI